MRIRRKVKLSEYSHYRIGGVCDFFAEPKDLKELKEALSLARKEKLPIFILGGGTNVLIKDSGFRGFVVHPKFKFFKLYGNKIEAGASILMDDLLKYLVRNKMSGLEWAGGLPGSVGGAVRGNAGCFGGETKDSLVSVKSVRVSDGKSVVRKNSECGFGYRNSIFKKNDGKEIIVSAQFKLKPGVIKDIKKSIREKIDYRWSRHPMEYPSLGSTFKNIPVAGLNKKQKELFREFVKNDPFPVVPVAYVISLADVMGKRIGGAMISPKHPNFIVNTGNAHAKDVEDLIALVKKSVWRKFRIKIEEEIIRV